MLFVFLEFKMLSGSGFWVGLVLFFLGKLYFFMEDERLRFREGKE